MQRTTLLSLLAALALTTAACGGERASTAETPDATAPDTATRAPDAGQTPPSPAGPAADPPASPRRSTSAEQLPTAADSAAAAAEDVSPEWKMRTRQMAPFADCMEKTRNAPPSVRPTLVEACHRLPDAPKRP